MSETAYPLGEYHVGDLLDILEVVDVGLVRSTVACEPANSQVELPEQTARVFVGDSQRQRYQRIFGGQLLAQGIVAAGRTAARGRQVHSLHATFLAGGVDTDPVHYVVEALGDGRSFSTRRVLAVQRGRVLATMSVSFQAAAAGVEHQRPMPAAPDPRDVPNVAEALDGRPGPYALVCVLDGPIEMRHVRGNLYAGPGPERSVDQGVWVRSVRPLPDDPLVHAAFLAYASDYSILEPVLRGHGLHWGDPRLRQASLDHAMWFHRSGRADDWVLHSGHSPSASGGRGLGIGHLYDRQGRLLATVAQEGMLRLKD